MDENLISGIKTYIAPVSSSSCELSVKKSLFISFASPIESQEDADIFLSEKKKKYPDARHHVYAWSVTGKLFREKYSDDHEPSGTAGLPISSLLSSNNISNVIVVVVRYFGGTLLGTGGLVRAYTKSASDALNASDLRLMSLNSTFFLKSEYADYEKIKRYCIENSLILSDEEYTETISFKISVPYIIKDKFTEEITDISSGRISFEEKGQKYMPGGKSILI